MSTVRERLKAFIKSQGLKTRQFEISIGASNGYVNGVINTIGPKFLNAILELYPNINREWLLFGEGTMLRTIEPNAELVGIPHKAIIEDTVPVRLFEVNPTATFQDFCSGEDETPTIINIIPSHGESLDESYCVFQISGESMAPQIQPGARILCQEVPPTRWHTLYGCIVVIAYSDKFVIKRIVTNHLQTDNYLILASDNPDYPARETVQLSDIRAIFKAQRIISSQIY